MRTLTDCFGHRIRLTDERLSHILEHAEMRGMPGQIERVLQHPELVRQSRTDVAVNLFYRFYAQTTLGGKWLCVVAKYGREDAFIVTA